MTKKLGVNDGSGFMGLKQKISALLILIGLTPFVVFYFYSAGKVAELTLQTNKDRLVSLRETKKNQIENYFKNIASQASTFSKSFMVVDAMDKFTSSFAQVEQQTTASESENKSWMRPTTEACTARFMVNIIPRSVDFWKSLDITIFFWLMQKRVSLFTVFLRKWIMPLT